MTATFLYTLFLSMVYLFKKYPFAMTFTFNKIRGLSHFIF
jgi:hypothetical protein